MGLGTAQVAVDIAGGHMALSGAAVASALRPFGRRRGPDRARS